MLRIFVDLENLRYEDKFEFDVDIDDEIDIDLVMIPGIILQPFIENAIEHGLSTKEEKGLLYLGIKKENSSLSIIIEDDGIGRKRSADLRNVSGKMGRSVGVNNVKRRMELLKSGNEEDDYNFEIEDFEMQNVKNFINKTNTEGAEEMKRWLGIHYKGNIYYDGNHWSTGNPTMIYSVVGESTFDNCGNGICDSGLGEDYNSCSDDCEYVAPTCSRLGANDDCLVGISELMQYIIAWKPIVNHSFPDLLQVIQNYKEDLLK